MKSSAVTYFTLFFLLSVLSSEAKMTPDQKAKLPPTATHPVDFSKDIRPILETSCANCHGHGRSKGSFRIDDRETFLKGSDSGAVVVVGKSDESLLIELVMGFDPDTVMPAKGSKLKPEQIALLRAWIDQGMKWEKGVWLGKVEAQNLLPRSPQVSANPKLSNQVDSLLNSYLATNKVKWPELVSDRVFARRAYLDVIGLLPPAADLEKFVTDKSADKRAKLVEKLLNDNRNYAEHWLTFWNDMLRNDYKGTGYIDGGRKQITKWLFSALETNMPYNQFVAQLVNPNSESEGFVKGINWRGEVNASQMPQMQAAQNISQVFMGINMKCASCHDSFVNDWQLSDAYALANIYSDEQLEIFRCDKPTGKKADTKFLYPEFGTINPAADKATRLKQLADCVVSPKNGRLSRTIVNRVWGRLIGRALVEPVDDMEQAAWNPDLLDWLAEDFVAHNYDVKHLLKQILTSHAYQMPAFDPGENQKEYVFHGPSVRRLSAEQFRDALTAVTGFGYSAAAADVGEMETSKKFNPTIPIKWIWNSKDAAEKAKAEHVYFRKTVLLPRTPNDAKIIVTCDNSFELFVNGKKVGAGSDYSQPSLFDIRASLKKGENVIAIHAINNLPSNAAPAPGAAVAGTENPAGLIVYARVRATVKGVEKMMDFATDKSWQLSNEQIANWEAPAFVAQNWTNAVEIGGVGVVPWRMKATVFATKLGGQYPGKIRSSLVNADPLMVALGRPNREQVVTTRPVEATTLQALEMTNGSTLAEILKRGAENLVGENVAPRTLIQKVYEQSLGRRPSADEINTAEQILGKTVQKEGVEDFLWAVTMLPEFQLIY